MFECFGGFFQVILVEITSLSLEIDVELCVLLHKISLVIPGRGIETCLHLFRNGSEGSKGLNGGLENEVYFGLQKFHLELLQRMLQEVVLVMFEDKSN